MSAQGTPHKSSAESLTTNPRPENFGGINATPLNEKKFQIITPQTLLASNIN